MEKLYSRKVFYAIPPLVMLIAGFGYVKKRVADNKDEFFRLYELSRDTTRPGNKSFGLNYGFKTDLAVIFMQIEEMLDTGDVVFMQSRCSRNFSVNEILHCYKSKIVKKVLNELGVNKSDWDTVGVLIRDKFGPRVLFYSGSEVYDLEYGETLSLPFFEDIAVRKMRTGKREVGKVGNEFRAMVSNENSVIRNPAEILIKYWKAAGIHNENEEEVGVEHVDCAKPAWLNCELAEYSEPIIVRTAMSRIDVENY